MGKSTQQLLVSFVQSHQYFCKLGYQNNRQYNRSVIYIYFQFGFPINQSILIIDVLCLYGVSCQIMQH